MFFASSIVVALVESESRPMGVTLVNTLHTNKVYDCMDLVELAKQVQKVTIILMTFLQRTDTHMLVNWTVSFIRLFYTIVSFSGQ